MLSDGWETVGSAAPLLPLLAERRQRLYPLAPPGAERLPNLAIQRIGAPQVVQKGDGVTLRLVLDNTHSSRVEAELALRQRDQPVWQGVVSLPPGVSVLTRAVSLSDDGLIPLRATLTPAYCSAAGNATTAICARRSAVVDSRFGLRVSLPQRRYRPRSRLARSS